VKPSCPRSILFLSAHKVAGDDFSILTKTTLKILHERKVEAPDSNPIDESC